MKPGKPNSTETHDPRQIDEFSYLKCLYTNADFLTNKFDLLKERLLDQDPDVISIVETATQSAQNSANYCPDDFLQLNGYQMYRQDNENEIKGGILVYVKDTIRICENKTINNLSSEFKESKWLELDVAGDKIIFGTIYRKGKSTAANNKQLLAIINKVTRMYDKVLICGDLNFPEIDWDTHIVSGGPMSGAAQFLNCINDNLLIQHVNECTRARGTDKPSLIDLIITDNTQSITDSIEYQAPLGYGDHAVLIWNYLVSVEEKDEELDNPNTAKWNVEKGDYIKLNSLLSEINWEEALQDKTLEECVDTFYSITHENMEKCIPKINKSTAKQKDKPPWMDRKARKQIRKKLCAWRRYQKSQNYSHYIQYVKCRDKTTQKLRKIKKEFEKKLALDCKKNPKAFYRYANFKNKSNKKIIRLRNKDGHIAMSDEMNANILNDFFHLFTTKKMMHLS